MTGVHKALDRPETKPAGQLSAVESSHKKPRETTEDEV